MSEETTSVLVAGVDIGGTGIKAAPVHVATGELAAERIRLPTPSPATPQAVASVVSEALRHIDVPGPVGLAIPAVVRGASYGRRLIGHARACSRASSSG